MSNLGEAETNRADWNKQRGTELPENDKLSFCTDSKFHCMFQVPRFVNCPHAGTGLTSTDHLSFYFTLPVLYGSVTSSGLSGHKAYT